MGTRAVGRTSMVALALALVLGACGGSGGGESAGAGDEPRTADDGASTSEQTSVPPSSASTTEPDEGLDLDCLQGSWVMKEDTLNIMIGSLLPAFPIRVTDGGQTIQVDGTHIVTDLKMEVTFDLPEGTAKSQLNQVQDGNVAIQEGVLFIEDVVVTGGWGNVTGSIGGVEVDVPVPPLAEFPTLSGGPATCTPDLLTITFAAPGQEFTTQYERG